MKHCCLWCDVNICLYWAVCSNPETWVMTVMDELPPGVCSFPMYGPTSTYTFTFKSWRVYSMATDLTIMFGPSEVPASPVLLNKKHFNPIGGHFIRVFTMCFQMRDPIGWDVYCTRMHYNAMRKWPPIGLKCILLNNMEYTATSEGPNTIVTSVAIE